MNLKKSALFLAMMSASSVASAVNVTSWTLTDFDSDGLGNDFAFYSAPTGNSLNAFDGDVNGGVINMGTTMAPGSFSTGFDFGGQGQFIPGVYDNGSGDVGVVADITGGVLTFSSLDFGGDFNGTFFELAPDILAPGNGGFNSGYYTEVTDLGGGDYGVVVRYVGTITGTGTSFDNFQSNWRLEGVMSTSAVPVPAAVWLFGSGLLGLAGVARRRKAA